MAAETAGVERALGAIGTTFRLMRLYPPTHPAVVEALKQIGEAIPGLADLLQGLDHRGVPWSERWASPACTGTASTCCPATHRSPSSPACCTRAACGR